MILDDETMVESPLASVVICTRNRGELIFDTIETVLANTHPSFELLVIDQSTNLITQNTVKHFSSDKRLRYIQTETVGTGISRYMGLVESKGEIVLYTDDDCRVPPNWIETVSEIFVKNEMIGMVFCNVVAGPYDEHAGFVPTYVIQNDFVARSIKDKPKARGIGAGMAVRRETALAMGGFDSLLGPGSPLSFTDCEDGDMAVRMLIKGWWVYETNRIAIIHDGFRTWEQGKELSKRNSVGIGAAYSKPIKAGYWQFMPTVLFEGIFLVLIRPLTNVLKLKRPQGLRRFIFFWYGFFLGLKVPIDSQKLVFVKK